MGSGESKGGQGSDQKEENAESSDTAIKAACALGAAAAGTAALIWGLSGAGQSEKEEVMSKQGDKEKKPMKAPGRDGELIPRESFAKDPKGYFRALHDEGK